MEIKQLANSKPIWNTNTVKNTKSETAEEILPASSGNKKDVCEISSDWEQSVDWEQKLKEYLEQISAANKNVEITIANLDDESLRDYAASLGEGAHLVLSVDFLHRMSSGSEAFYKGKNLLENLVSQLSQAQQPQNGVGAYVNDKTVTFWQVQEKPEYKLPSYQKEDSYKTLFELMEEMRKKAEENKAKFQINLGSSIFNSPTEAFTRLSNAVNVSGVKSAMSLAERSICTMKLALSSGPDKDKAKIRAAITALEKVISRGRGKIKDLNNEDDLLRRQKRAEAEQKQRRAEQIRYERKQKQTSRHSREQAQITEGEPWFYYQEELFREKQIFPECESVEIVASVETSAFVATDVNVSPAIAISI